MIPPRFATSTGRGCIVEEIDGERIRPVCVCYGSDDDVDGDQRRALRIAALLNFAEGVPTEELRGSLLDLAAAATLATDELRLARAVAMAGVS